MQPAVTHASEDQSETFAGRYVALQLLGSGGTGAVYRATDLVRGRDVALKRLRVPDSHKKKRRLEALFEAEFHVLSRVKHPHMIEVYDYGIAQGSPYYTMELLAGTDLSHAAPLPYKQACLVLRDIASSLALLHAHRLLHRDVSPRNIRIDADGHAKLIDFGALTSFGTAREIVGTPNFMAPEVLRRTRLDQRTDLYALGGVAYWALTGELVYDISRLEDLPSAWKLRPRRPSELVADLPPALDALVMSLLNVDPIARPPSAADVIAQLTAVADLPPEDNNFERVADSYLQSGPLVGREAELKWVRDRLQRALRGEGTEILVEGPAGIGRTRFLNDLCLDAQLHGTLTLHVDAQADSKPYGLVRSLATQLLELAPAVARRAAHENRAVLAELWPQLRAQLDAAEGVQLPEDPHERRARLQTALHAWFVGAASEVPLLVAVDDIQAADDDSAAFVAGLGRASRQACLVMLVTQRAGAPVLAPAALRELRRRCGRLKLAGLNAASCEQLVRALFGDAANTGRMSRLLFEHSAGNPHRLMELARLLVRKNIVRYVGGTWVLPLEVSEQEIPKQAEDVPLMRLSPLSAAARELAEALSIHRGAVSIERCLELIPGLDERDVYAALDALVAAQVLVRDGAHFRFELAALADGLERSIDDERRRLYHRRAAKSWLRSADAGVRARTQAAWHLLQAGQEREGADMLARSRIELLHDNATPESIEQTVRAMTTALEVYLRTGRSKYEVAGLLFTLLPYAFFVDRQIALKYGELAIDLGLEITGLGRAQRLCKVFGKRLGLQLSLVGAGVRFSTERKRGLSYGLPEAIGAFCGVLPSVIGTYNICYEIDRVRRVTAAIGGLAAFGSGHIASLMHDYAHGQLAMGEGREWEARELLTRMLEQFDTPEILSVLGHGHFYALKGGIHYALGILDPYEFGARAVERARAMNALPVRLWAMAADQVLMLHHALRGESEQVRLYRERIELYAVQGGTTWQAELFWPVLLLSADVLTQDAVATRRTWEQLSRRASDSPALAAYAQAAEAAYLAMQGRLSESIALYERVLPQLPLRRRVAWSSIRAHFAETLNAAGQHARAEALLRDTLACALPQERVMVGRFLELERQLALAQSGLGKHDAAARMLDELLVRHASEDQPLLIGLLHKARAEVALRMDDAPVLEQHVAECERLFRGTRNPALIAQADRLLDSVRRKRLPEGWALPANDTSAQPEVSGMWQHERQADSVASAPDPGAAALSLILQATCAQQGYLFLYDNSSLRLCSASSPLPPPSAAESHLLSVLQRAQIEADQHAATLREGDGLRAVQLPWPEPQTHAVQLMRGSILPLPISHQGSLSDVDEQRTVTEFVSSIPPGAAQADDPFWTIVLSTQREGRTIVVAGALVRGPATRIAPVEPGLLTAIASALYERWLLTAS